MITEKANAKLLSCLRKYPNKTKEIAQIVAASNVLITDIKKNGILILKHLERHSPDDTNGLWNF